MSSGIGIATPLTEEQAKELSHEYSDGSAEFTDEDEDDSSYHDSDESMDEDGRDTADVKVKEESEDADDGEIVKHERFYFDDGNLFILVSLDLESYRLNSGLIYSTKVDDTLFRVHEYFFVRDSHLFASMLNKIENILGTYLGGIIPPERDVPEEEKLRVGTTCNFPLELEDQDVYELECFLSLLYPYVLSY